MRLEVVPTVAFGVLAGTLAAMWLVKRWVRDLMEALSRAEREGGE